MKTQISKAQENPSLGVMLMIGFCICAPLFGRLRKIGKRNHSRRSGDNGALFLSGDHHASDRVGNGIFVWLPNAFDAQLGLPRAYVDPVHILFSWPQSPLCPLQMPLPSPLSNPSSCLLLENTCFSESVGYRRLIACTVGFIGILLVIQPSFAAFGWVALFPLGTAVFFAFYMFVTRTLSRDMHAVQMQFHSSWIGTLMCATRPDLASGSGIVQLDPVWPGGGYFGSI